MKSVTLISTIRSEYDDYIQTATDIKLSFIEYLRTNYIQVYDDKLEFVGYTKKPYEWSL
jgi:hypothetical protein